MERVDRPADLTVRAWWHALRDAAKSFHANHLTDNAAALTYYSVLSIFPGLIVLVSLLGVLGNEGTIDSFLKIIDQLGSQSAVDAVQEPVTEIVESSNAAGIALVLGITGGLWSASGYVGAFMRASNEIYAVEEERPFWKLRPLQIVITLVMTLILALVLIALVLTGPLTKAIGDEVGVGDTALTVFSIAKWPILFVMVIGVIGVLYRFSPNARHEGMRWILPGSLLATVLWLAASAGFSLYVANFGSYGNTYGSLAGAIVFLIWLWITNVAVLFGAQFAAELERTAMAAEGATPPGEFAPFVSPARDAELPPEGGEAAPPQDEERTPSEGYSTSAPPAGAGSISGSGSSGSAVGPEDPPAARRR
ncbi:MAG: YihY family inner membrane protein [Solirubrobacterales bacterium]|nr:YihY family inner membrane protein [Solirubrobacterales bacterium]